MKTFNTVLSIFAVLAIVALSAFNVHKVGEQAKIIAELQQYHQCELVDTVNLTDSVLEPTGIWGSIEEVIQYRKDDITWVNVLEQWRSMPEISLRHILQHHGLHLAIEQIVEIYNSNINYYKAYEEGYLTPKLPDPQSGNVKPEKKKEPVEERPPHSNLESEDSLLNK